MIVVEPLKGPPNHRVSKMMRSLEGHDLGREPLLDTEVRGLPSHFFTEAAQPGSATRHRPFAGLTRRASQCCETGRRPSGLGRARLG